LLYWLGELLQGYFGPFRLLTSRLFLGSVSLSLCFFLTFWLLPRLMNRLPRDRGRAHAVQGGAAQGKPTGAGVIFMSIFVLVQLLVMPWSFQPVVILVLTFLAMLSGWFDDKSVDSWGEYRKGLIDLLLSFLAAWVLCDGPSLFPLGDTNIWLPFTKETLAVPPWIFVPAGTVLIWTAINSTNCTDGVDGLSGTLSALALTSLGGLLYFVLGHQEIANYLLLPHYPDGATWGIMAFAMVGTIVGYLWYNAHPSILLMGDAGSRALGFLLGVFVLKSGNPTTIFIVSAVLLVNGGTGLVKVALKRFAKISIFKTVRFPLHDHVRHNKGWSNPQVLVRFSVVQVMLTLILLVLLIKIR
jgi:phospho-N-acetylmuramoyl-pentapeptide-transferase